MGDILKPVYVAPIVAYLCHEDCQDTGGVFEVYTHSSLILFHPWSLFPSICVLMIVLSLEARYCLGLNPIPTEAAHFSFFE